MRPDPLPAGAPPTDRRAAWLAAALAVGALLLAAPSPDGLPPAGHRAAVLFVVALILWVTEVLPIGVTALLVLISQPILGVANIRTAFNAFISPVFFFVFAMFCIAVVIVSSGLDRRFALWLLSKAGTDSRRVVFAFMIGTAAVSSIMSDVPACAVFMALALGVLKKAGISPGSSSFGKALMIGIPIASYIGGVATPAGSSVNIIGIHMLEQYGGVRVPFVTWMLVGIPMAVVLVPLACVVLLRIYPPELQSIGSVSEVASDRAALGRLGSHEKKALVVLSTMITAWIASSWFPQLDITVIGVAGAIAMFLPGVGLLTWKQAERGTAWDVLFLLGAVTSLGAASDATGLAGWLVTATLGGVAGWDLVWVISAISGFTVLVLLVVPIGPVVNALLIPPIVLLAIANGVHPLVYALPVAFTASCALLLPLNPVALITYSTGYYRMLDMLLPGAILSMAWVVWLTALMIWLAPVITGLG